MGGHISTQVGTKTKEAQVDLQLACLNLMRVSPSWNKRVASFRYRALCFNYETDCALSPIVRPRLLRTDHRTSCRAHARGVARFLNERKIGRRNVGLEAEFARGPV